MSKVTFKSLEDMQQYSNSGTKLCDDICGRISGMLLHLRKSRGLSKQTVSDATGIKVATIKLVESDCKRLKWGPIARLMHYYGVWVELKFIAEPREIKLEELLK